MDSKELSLEEAMKVAQKSALETDGRRGDPSVRASWIRERQLAFMVIALITRLKNNAIDSIEVPL